VQVVHSITFSISVQKDRDCTCHSTSTTKNGHFWSAVEASQFFWTASQLSTQKTSKANKGKPLFRHLHRILIGVSTCQVTKFAMNQEFWQKKTRKRIEKKVGCESCWRSVIIFLPPFPSSPAIFSAANPVTFFLSQLLAVSSALDLSLFVESCAQRISFFPLFFPLLLSSFFFSSLNC